MTETRRTSSRPPVGPHPGLLTTVSLALLVASLLSTAILTGGAFIPSPSGPAAEVTAFYVEHAAAVRIAALLQLASAVPLGIAAATFHARQHRLGIRVPGPTIGLVGGITAAVLLVISACVTWSLGSTDSSVLPGIGAPLAYLSFATGGFAHVVGLGLLVAGIAVPGLLLRLMPRGFCLAGLVLALLAELSILSMVITPLQMLIPLGRFGSLGWLVAAGFLIPRDRSDRPS